LRGQLLVGDASAPRAVQPAPRLIVLAGDYVTDYFNPFEWVRGFKTWVLAPLRVDGGLWEHRRILLSFAYLAFLAVLRLLVGGRRSEFAKDVELLVLRHQLGVLARQVMSATDSLTKFVAIPRRRPSFI
jgi:hypothetical protein